MYWVSGPNRAIQPQCAIRITNPLNASDPAKILRCCPTMRKIGVLFKIVRCEMPIVYDSDPRCGLACDASARDACSECSPNFLRSFCASFRGKRRPEKIHQKSPSFFSAKVPGKFEEKIYKSFLESWQSNIWSFPSVSSLCDYSTQRSWRLL